MTIEKNILIEEIKRLKAEKNVVILAHYYQSSDIQDVADYVGDSLGLAIQAKKTEADLILFAGVYFMAETAKMLNPTKKVILPDLNAGCSLADNCIPSDVSAFKKRHPEYILVSYINCSAEVKSLSDIVCTSSNALKIVESIEVEKPILFLPDKNLGRYIQKNTNRKIRLWDGSCVVHEAFSLQKLIDLKTKNPIAKIVAHPESDENILNYAHFIGSTSEIINYINLSDDKIFIVATEEGILHQLRLNNPSKELIPAPVYDDTSCSCSECAYMKVNTLQKIYVCLRDEQPEIKLSEKLIADAVVPVERMLSLQ
jgi:quinolinate synthase